MNAQAPAGWRVPSALVRAARSGHSVLGLGVATLLYIVVLSGSLLMFAPQFDHGQQMQAPVVTHVTPALAQQALDELPGGLSAWREVTLTYPSAQLSQLVLSAQSLQGEPRRFAVDTSGTLRPLRPRWSAFLLDLHESLMLPGLLGGVLVGLLGIALLTMLVGGVLSYPRLFRDAFLFRSHAHEWMRQADLHHRLGAWALPFHLAMGFSGAAMALALPVAALVGPFGYGVKPAAVGAALLGPSPDANRAPVAAPDLGAILGQVEGNPVAIQRIVIMHPSWQSRLIRVDVDKPHRLAYGDRYFFDADGHLVTPGGMLDHRSGLPFYSGLVGLHFGGYGGAPLRIVYGLLGLALCTVVASGMRQWLALQRTRGRPRARTERLWAGWVWGSALALVVSYDCALIRGLSANSSPVVFACVLALALLASLGIRDLTRLRWSLRGAFGAGVMLGGILIWM